MPVQPAGADLGGGHAEPVVLGRRYRLERPIGAGATDLIWQAADERLRRTVAVQELRLGSPDQAGAQFEQARQQVLREARLAAGLQHVHAVAVLDLVVAGDRQWLVTEYVTALSLADVIAERGTLSVRAAATIGGQIADALAAAHAVGVVHRDIKPGNVLCIGDGTVKLTGFGASRAPDEPRLAGTGVITETPAYLAPEIALGGSPTAASDVFALGATLFEAVEGHPPFGPTGNAHASVHPIANGRVTAHRGSAGPLTAALMHLLREPSHERPTATEARDRLYEIAELAEPAGTVTMGSPQARAMIAATSRRVRQLGRSWTTRERRLDLAATLAILVVLLVSAALILTLGPDGGSARADGTPATARRDAVAPARQSAGPTTSSPLVDEPAPLVAAAPPAPAAGAPAPTVARLVQPAALTAGMASPKPPAGLRGARADQEEAKGHRGHGHGHKKGDD